MKARQPTGHAQSPLSNAFPIIILLDTPLFKRCMLMGTVPKAVHLDSRQDRRQLRYSSTLANSLHGMEDYVLHLCVVKSGHLALQTC